MPSTISTGRSLSLDAVMPCGWLAERIDRAYVAVENLFGSLWWGGTMWGLEHPARWLRNVVLYGTHTGVFHAGIPEVVERLLTLIETGQTATDYTKNQIAAYSESELLMGLLAYHAVFPDARVLAACRHIGTSIVENHRLNNHYYKGLAIERLLTLSKLTGDAGYRDAAIAIAEEQQLALLKVEGGTHGAAASMILNNYLLLCEETGDKRYLAWAKTGWQAIHERMMSTGGIGEVLEFTRPPAQSDLHDETCQTSWWILFNLQLWRITGDPSYLDLVERIFYNHFLFQQLHRGEDGGFTALNDIDQGFRGEHNYICCDNEGFYGLLSLLSYAITMNEDGRTISINLPFPLKAGVWGAEVSIESPYPTKGAMGFTINAAQPLHFELRIRIPGGTAASCCLLNDHSVPYHEHEGYISIRREWQSGDTVRVAFPLALQIEEDASGAGPRSGKVIIDGRESEAKRIAVLFGPVVSAIFRTGHANDLSWIWTGDYPEVLDSGGSALEGYPMSNSAELDVDGAIFHTGHAVPMTEVSSDGVPRLRWTLPLGERVQVQHEVRVLPGLPVMLECRETITGWNGRGQLRCAGLRFGVVKTNRNARYQGHRYAWLYPFPTVTTKPDLSDISTSILGHGTSSGYERLADNTELAKTGTIRMSNGFFRAICLYDPAPVGRVVGRVTEHWAGVYFEPEPTETIVLTRRLIFPLFERPLCQGVVQQMLQRAGQIHAQVVEHPDGTRSLILEGESAQNVPVLLPKTLGLQSGCIVSNNIDSTYLFSYDKEHLAARLDVPGSYRL